MKVTVERSELLRSLGHVHRVVERRNTIPILANVLVRGDRAKLALKATDLDLEVIDAVATDGHRLAQTEIDLPDGAAGIPGIIVPRKTVGEVQRLIEDGEAEVAVELSAGKIRFTVGEVILTSKLIDGTFPDYARVIPL